MKRRSGRLKYVTMPNFVEIGSLIAEILQFFVLSKWSPPSWFFEFAKFYGLKGSRGLRCTILPICYGDIVIYFYFSGWSQDPEGRDTPSIQISSKSAYLLWRYCHFSFFWRWRPFAILNLDHPWRVLGVKFGFVRCSNFDNMNISIFGTIGWTKPIYAPKIEVLGLFDPINGL